MSLSVMWDYHSIYLEWSYNPLHMKDIIENISFNLQVFFILHSFNLIGLVSVDKIFMSTM